MFSHLDTALMRRLGMGVALAIPLAVCLAVLRSCMLPPSVLEHSLSIRGDNALIAEVELSLSRAGQAFVEYENPRAGKFRTAPSESGAKHRISVARLRAETTYSYAIWVQDAGGKARVAQRGEFRTGPLPQDLATMHMRASGRSSQPLILTRYTRIGHHDYIVFLDEAGEIVWYHVHDRVGGFAESAPGAIEQKSNGNLIHINSWCCITEITPLGEVVRQLVAGDEAGIPHHDFVLLDDGRILYPSEEETVFDDSASGGEAETSALAETLRIWDPESGRVEQVWDSRDFWDIESADQWNIRKVHRRALCWMHINSVSLGLRGNFILSSRHRQQILSVSADFQTIEWQLGGPGSSYRFPNPSDRFYAQHDATQLPNGNILLFDNGRRRPAPEGGEYSRAIEFRLDDERRSAVKAWEFRADPDIYSPRVSGAARLGNGNTLISFGNREKMHGQHDLPVAVLEVDPQGNERFRVEALQLDRYLDKRSMLNQFWAVGGIGSIMGETMLRAPAARSRTEASVADGQQYWKAAQQQYREHRLNRYRVLHEALISGDFGGPLARSTFDIHLGDRALIYLKRPCDADDAQAKFLLHIFPVDEGDLPPSRRQFGFDNFDFPFHRRGEFLNGECIVERPLPDYPIDRIRTGQFVLGEAPQWKAEFPVNMP